jgi:hypothetical protein
MAFIVSIRIILLSLGSFQFRVNFDGFLLPWSTWFWCVSLNFIWLKCHSDRLVLVRFSFDLTWPVLTWSNLLPFAAGRLLTFCFSPPCLDVIQFVSPHFTFLQLIGFDFVPHQTTLNLSCSFVMDIHHFAALHLIWFHFCSTLIMLPGLVLLHLVAQMCNAFQLDSIQYCFSWCYFAAVHLTSVHCSWT